MCETFVSKYKSFICYVEFANKVISLLLKKCCFLTKYNFKRLNINEFIR